MTLYLLMESAIEAAEDNKGEIPDELRGPLLDCCEAFGVKVDNIASYIKSQENDARNAKREIDRLQSRASAAENRVERVHGELTGSSGYRSLVQASTMPPPPVRIETSW